MIYTSSQIFQALNIIQTTCDEYHTCNTCPLRGYMRCGISSSKPRCWDLNDPDVWVAFKGDVK